MQTIVQDYGPIYGEVVNGTVQGRPNGSVYVPISNTLSISSSASSISLDSGLSVFITNLDIVMVAQSQDLASYIRSAVYSDAACTTMVGSYRNRSAGTFNVSTRWVGNGTTPLTPGSSYYIRAELVNNGVAVATSNVLTVVAT